MLLYNLKRRTSSVFNSEEKDFFSHFPSAKETEERVTAESIDVISDGYSSHGLYNLTQFFMFLDKSIYLGIPIDRIYLGDNTCEAYKKFKYTITSLLLFDKLEYGDNNYNIESIYPMNKRALLIK